MDYTKLELKIFYPSAIESSEIDDYNAVFELWHRVWVETRREVDASLPTPSDNFSRQSEILALFHSGKAIGTICHRYVDLRHKSVLSDSYFSPGLWPEPVRQRLPSLGSSCVLGSHVFVDRAFRKLSSGAPTKDLLCGLSFEHINGTRPDVVLGMMRKDKGMHELFYNSGALALLENTSWYQIPVDLVAFFPAKELIRVDGRYRGLVQELGGRCAKFKRNYFLDISNQGAGYVTRAA